jgi:hypothetical protein
MNDAVTFRNHNNGWWTIELQRTGQSVKLPLFYMAVWGFRPDDEMEDGVIPTEVPGTVTDPALFKKLGIAGMKRGDRVVIETDGKNGHSRVACFRRAKVDSVRLQFKV